MVRERGERGKKNTEGGSWGVIYHSTSHARIRISK